VSIRIRFWGTRGSLPAPLDARGVAAKLRTALRLARKRGIALDDDALDAFIADLPFDVRGTYGGNTSCVQLDVGHRELTICDAGSGLRAFGDAALGRFGSAPQTYNLFLSHVHWDHIMGFPFFRPAYIAGNVIRIHACHADARTALEREFGPPSFPVEFDRLPATIEFVRLEPERTYEIGGFTVRATPQHHPGRSFGYRFSTPDATVVYATDSEHAFSSTDEEAPFVALFRDADVLIFDAMYSLGESVSLKEDWGHSSNIVGVELAQRANVRHLVLFHHDPNNDDPAIDRYVDQTRRFEEITRRGPGIRISAAYDGREIMVPE
jgi:phosphoribosyl 1,2-cyclic phosphodiesterase